MSSHHAIAATTVLNMCEFFRASVTSRVRQRLLRGQGDPVTVVGWSQALVDRQHRGYPFSVCCAGVGNDVSQLCAWFVVDIQFAWPSVSDFAPLML